MIATKDFALGSALQFGLCLLGVCHSAQATFESSSGGVSSEATAVAVSESGGTGPFDFSSFQVNKGFHLPVFQKKVIHKVEEPWSPPSHPAPSPCPPSPPPPSPAPPPMYPHCKTYKGPWDGKTVFQLAAEENTTPYDIHTSPYTGKDITRGLDPDTSLEELLKKFAGGKAELKICPGSMKPVGSNSCLDDLYKRRPCEYLQGKERYECLCSFRADGMYRDPYDKSCTGVFTCKDWQLVGKKTTCPSGKVAAPGDYRSGESSDASLDICVPVPSANNNNNYICSEGAPCTSATCMCDTYLLPTGQYINPWDSSGRTWITCDNNKGASTRWTMPAEIFACNSLFQYYNPAARSCQDADKPFCAIKESDGACEVAFLPFYTCEPQSGPPADGGPKKRRKLLQLGPGNMEFLVDSIEETEQAAHIATNASVPHLFPYEDALAQSRQLLGTRASGQSIGGTRNKCQRLSCCKTELVQAAIGLSGIPPLRNKAKQFPPIQYVAAKRSSPTCRVEYSFACPVYAQGKCKKQRLIPNLY